MKLYISFRSVCIILMVGFLFSEKLYAQDELTGQAGKYSYYFVKGDPFKVHRYVLSNGFTVMISVNKKEPRIQTYLAVKAGSKTDPADNTGLAHYLEHMLFKGTSRFGTLDYKKEKIYLDQIDGLYRQYNQEKEEARRIIIYHQIDSVSGLAAKYAIANEYDKMMQSIGAVGTNAFTSFEQTVYVNDIPSSNLEKWLEIEAERFKNPVFRIFHTELEAVFEEKNISLDNDDSKVYERIMSGLFPDHPYGTQTTIGTVEHLKNPSLDKIRAYFNKWYCPANMALILTGDFEEEKAIAWAEKYFGNWNKPFQSSTQSLKQSDPKSDLPPVEFPTEINTVPVNEQNVVPMPAGAQSISLSNTNLSVAAPNNLVSDIYGPSAGFIMAGWRFPGAGTRDAAMLKLVSQLLFNGKGGLLDIDLVKSQKVGSLVLYADVIKEHSYMVIKAKPSGDGSLEALFPMIYNEILKLKTGDFSTDMVHAVIANMKVELIRKQESREATSDLMLDAFTTDQAWKNYIDEFNTIQILTREEIISFCNTYFTETPVLVYKREGEDKSIVKVSKPAITPVDVESNRDKISGFAKKVLSKKAAPVLPEFIDYNRTIKNIETVAGQKVLYIKNKENDLYTLNIVWEFGKEQNKLIPMAVQLLKIAGTQNLSSEKFNSALYNLATDFNITSNNKSVVLSLSGLKENMGQALALVNALIDQCVVSDEGFAKFKNQIYKLRKDDLMNKGLILRSGLRNYALYGADNPFNYNLSNKEIEALTLQSLKEVASALKSLEHKVYYFGSEDPEVFARTLAISFNLSTPLKKAPAAAVFKPKIASAPTIFFVDYDMVQAEIMWVKNENIFKDSLMPISQLFQEYYGGGMGSIVFQTIRESKALAYSCNLRFSNPEKAGMPYTVNGYIGTQSDKLFESIDAMNELLNKMPQSEELLKSCKSTIRSQTESERVNGIDIIYNYEYLSKLGIIRDIRRDVYEAVNKFTLKDLEIFFNNYLADGGYTLCLVGSKAHIPLEKLKKYGEIKEIKIESLFGY